MSEWARRWYRHSAVHCLLILAHVRLHCRTSEEMDGKLPQSKSSIESSSQWRCNNSFSFRVEKRKKSLVESSAYKLCRDTGITDVKKIIKWSSTLSSEKEIPPLITTTSASSHELLSTLKPVRVTKGNALQSVKELSNRLTQLLVEILTVGKHSE